MSDYLLLAGVALCLVSVVAAIVQLLQTRPPRAAVIMLVVGIALIFASAFTSPDPLSPGSVVGAWDRITAEVARPAP